MFFILYFTPYAYSQWYYNSCPLDSTMNLQLRIDIIDQNSDGDSISINSFVSVPDPESGNCESFYLNLNTYSVLDRAGKKLFKCNPSKIKNLEIYLYGKSGYPFTMNLNNFDFIKSLSAPKLEKFKIISQAAYFQFDISKWKMYKELIKSQSLRDIYVKGIVLNENWFDPFTKYKNIRKIKVSENLSYQLEKLPNVRELDFPNMYYFFSLSIISATKLINMPSYKNENIGDGNLYPEITFFANSLSPSIIGHPYYSINKRLQEKKLHTDSSYSGKKTLTNLEVYPDFYDSSCFNDTVAVGQVVNGEPTGTWRFKMPYFQIGSDWYYYNYSDTINRSFPKNGKWSYKYPDGKLAISGKFRNGLKDGEWKFYNNDGFLVNVKSFEKGKPRGLFKNYWKKDGLTIELRKYLLNSQNFIYGIQGENGLNIGSVSNNQQQFSSLLIMSYLVKTYTLNKYGDLFKYKDGKLKKEIQKDSWKYKRIIKRKFLKKLYPDKKLSIKDIKFKSK